MPAKSLSANAIAALETTFGVGYADAAERTVRTLESYHPSVARLYAGGAESGDAGCLGCNVGNSTKDVISSARSDRLSTILDGRGAPSWRPPGRGLGEHASPSKKGGHVGKSCDELEVDVQAHRGAQEMLDAYRGWCEANPKDCTSTLGEIDAAIDRNDAALADALDAACKLKCAWLTSSDCKQSDLIS